MRHSESRRKPNRSIEAAKEKGPRTTVVAEALLVSGQSENRISVNLCQALKLSF
jgi:hypothetical protein